MVPHAEKDLLLISISASSYVFAGEGVLGEINLGNSANWPRIFGRRGAYCPSYAGRSRSQ